MRVSGSDSYALLFLFALGVILGGYLTLMSAAVHTVFQRRILCDRYTGGFRTRNRGEGPLQHFPPGLWARLEYHLPGKGGEWGIIPNPNSRQGGLGVLALKE